MPPGGEPYSKITREGISVRIDGHAVLAGNLILMLERGIALNGLEEKARSYPLFKQVVSLELAAPGLFIGLLAICFGIYTAKVNREGR